MKAIIDIVANAVPGMTARHRRNRINGIGIDLYRVYIALNRILVNGDQIVATLEQLAALDDTQPITQGASRAFRKLQGAAESQAQAITEACELLRSWGSAIIAMQPEGYRDVSRLLFAKESRVELLSHSLSRYMLPLRDGGHVDLRDYPDPSYYRLMALGHEGREIVSSVAHDAWGPDVVPTVEQWWEPDHSRILREYLAEFDPRAQLDELSAALKSIGDALSTHFTVADLLPEIGQLR